MSSKPRAVGFLVIFYADDGLSPRRLATPTAHTAKNRRKKRCQICAMWHENAPSLIAVAYSMQV